MTISTRLQEKKCRILELVGNVHPATDNYQPHTSRETFPSRTWEPEGGSPVDRGGSDVESAGVLGADHLYQPGHQPHPHLGPCHQHKILHTHQKQYWRCHSSTFTENKTEVYRVSIEATKFLLSIISMSMSPYPCLHIHVSMSAYPCLHIHVSMSPCPGLHVHVSMSMSM